MEPLSRRYFLAVSNAAYPIIQSSGRLNQTILVVGAGCFGGWTALQLLRFGAKVILVDAWGPGNSRASSAGETRVIRATYGDSKLYTRLSTDALHLWKENQQSWNRKLFYPTGAIWMAGPKDEYERAALPVLSATSVPFERLSPTECAKRWPHIDFAGVSWSIYEPEAGYLMARRGCEAVYDAFLAEGGQYRHAAVIPGELSGKELKHVLLNQVEKIRADLYVFACGPWLPRMFPFLRKHFRISRQEVFFFGTAAGDARYVDPTTPVWIDNGKQLYYGIPGNQWRGFKLADDARGPEFDPDNGDRRVTDTGIEAARAYLYRRFPGMKGAPLLETRVCQYENSADENFILDRHPEAENAWLLGGGSGHGFKHGPAIGLMAASAVLGKSQPPALFALNRFPR